MPFISIKRKKQYADRLRAYEIMVNGQKIKEIRAEETVRFEIPGGTHQIFLKIDWCRSNELELNLSGQEEAYFECKNNTKTFQELYYILFARDQYLWLKRISKDEFQTSHSV